MNRTHFLRALPLPAVSLMPSAAQAATHTAEVSHEYVRHVIAVNQKIVSPDGIEELRSIDVHGCTQWLSIRGRDLSNPVLLYIHGGPGSPTMPESWTFQSPWEDFFTVVQWDQRGAGKTYASNDPATIAPTMTAQQMIADTEFVVRFLLEHLGQRKLFALGHSWGSYLGLELARRHPEWLYGYVGTGQMIDTQRSEAEGYEFALRQATLHHNSAAIAELRTIAPYPGPIGTLTVKRIGVQRKWLVYYGGLTYGRTNFDYDGDAWQFSPDYTGRDIRLADDGSLFSLNHLIGVVERTNFESATEFACPIFIFQGSHDYETSYPVVKEWFARVRAPRKRFVTFSRSAHMAMLEQPGEYLLQLVDVVRPAAA
ncbi:MAG TPA: alpha/beta hydrolase [Candidatus Cybelea sp.]|jgi:pimeloyl-ACP methyl ester carboxylesterase|nr:alpha/beta hydrolase [Candidatus Cybelea sp.]